MLKSNSYLVSTSCNILCSLLFKFLLFDTIFFKSDFWYCASKLLHVRRVESSTCSLSHNYSFLNLASQCRLEGSFIETVHPSYAPPLPFIVQPDKYKSKLSSNNKSQPMIMSYYEFPVIYPRENSMSRSFLRLIQVITSPHWFYMLLENHRLRCFVWLSGYFCDVIFVCVSLVLSRSLHRIPV